MSSFTSKTLLAALAGAVSVAAHGHVQSVTVDGQTFKGFTPFNGVNNIPAGTVGWATTASDNGFVLPSAFGTRDIACHKGSINAKSSVTVAAGGKLTLTWDTWPDSHKGPVLDYLASCGSAGCASADVTTLQFFKIDEAGLENGVWAADQLIKDGMKWEVTIPSSIKAGEYVLRHEMIGLHEGDRANGAQNYPQCINLVVTGSGTETPTGVLATKLYTAQDPGILFNIYNNPTSYPIPGPAVFSSGGASNNGGNGNGNSGGASSTTSQPAATPKPTSTKAATQSSKPTSTKAATQSSKPTSTPVSDCQARRIKRQARREAVRKAVALKQ